MTENFKDSSRLVASYLLPLSLFALAGSLAYFTYEMAAISRQIPDILVSVDKTSEKIEPIVDEAGNIIELVPPILKEFEEVRKLVPPILREVELIRKQIPPLLKEFELTRKQIPVILKEVEAVRKEVPSVLASADRASEAVVAVSKEVEATRPLISEVLKEVESTRESIPPLMDRADVLIEKARVAGKEASTGAVTGLFKGIIMAPFVLVGDAGKMIAGVSDEDAKKFSERDFDLIEQAALDLLNNGSKGEMRQWRSAETSNHGTVELMHIYTQGDFFEYDCRTLRIKSYKNDEEIKNITRSLCKNDKEQWDFDE